MLTNTKHLEDFSIRATDGELGRVRQFYFDDETWGIRYLIVDTGGWLNGREVLISPISIVHLDWDAKRLELSLTKKQIENSPVIDTHLPVSRQHETSYLAYYGYPSYWNGPYLWGPSFSPSDLFLPNSAYAGGGESTPPLGSADHHLRSTEAVQGYGVHALDGPLGHLDGFVVDDERWVVRYIEVATRGWLPGKKVLISPSWIARVSWAESTVYTDLARESIRNAPEYLESRVITRDYEDKLRLHYGRDAYWVLEEKERFSSPLATV